MKPSTASAPRLCDERQHARFYTMHRQKIANIKPGIDNKAPPMYPHLYQKLKKAQMEEERCSEIERDNRTLVKRMTSIMQRGAIDNSKPPAMVASLNKVRRRQELARITKENSSLLRRIQERQPTYNHLQWEQDRERNEQLCDRLCRYPYRPSQQHMQPSPNRDRLPPIDAPQPLGAPPARPGTQ